MSRCKWISAVLATIMLLTCVLATVGCKPREIDTSVTTYSAFGNEKVTDVVKNPSKDVKITLIRGKNVIDSADGCLVYEGSLQAGDIIEIHSDYCYLNVNLFEALGEHVLYSPTGQFTFQVPPTATQAIYPSGTFGGTSHEFCASVVDDEQLAEANQTPVNVTQNPYDYMFVDEKNNATATTLPEETLDSHAVASQQVTAYPHAYANRVTRNEAGFYARNAIDGFVQSDGHGNYPYQSWGYNQMDDAEFVVYFGRKVTLHSVAFVLRADFSGSKEHDTYWQSATVEFEDQSTQELQFEKTGEKQTFELESVVETSWVRIKNLEATQNANSQMFAALTEFEAYATECVSQNQVATKTYTSTTIGGKDQSAFSTDYYSYQEVKDIMDKANHWFIEKTESENFTIPDWNNNAMQVKINDDNWKDAVYYSGLMESFLVTGDMDTYYFLRSVGNQFKYLNDNGSNTPHGDSYQIGESFLILNDLRETNYKMAHTLANAKYNTSRDMNNSSVPSSNGSEWLDPSRDWSHMGFWWCDALYMALNTYTLLTIQTGDSSYVEKAHEGYLYWKEELYNTTYDLWWRDSSQKSLKTNSIDPETGERYPVFWSRGNAWVLAALAKQLLYLDKDAFPEIYQTYEDDFVTLAQAIAKYQRADGTWNASIVDESYYGGKETTGTCGYIYGMCVGLRLGILDESYFDVVSLAYDCIIENCMFESGQVGFMQTTGYQPQNYNSEQHSMYNTHEFGMGLFLLASSGVMSICSDYQAPSIVIPADPQAMLL
ncbi:MAG: glycoside hydrolase family 88 protein [Clostridia bacterium]|nr:glycoside hydrolase family 88 protein [Clostridia bacterium]MBQ3042300.1 glycoside hydrolase family 88 protein [Clostridia bacterium]